MNNNNYNLPLPYLGDSAYVVVIRPRHSPATRERIALAARLSWLNPRVRRARIASRRRSNR